MSDFASAATNSSCLRCAPFDQAIIALRHAQSRRSGLLSVQRGSRDAAVCLTGQLRLLPVSWPSLVENLLLPLTRAHGHDLFYVGPADRSFDASSCLLNANLPRATFTYDAAVDFGQGPGRANEHGAAVESAKSGRDGAPRLTFDLFTRRYRAEHAGCNDACCSSLLQAFQSRQCLSLIAAEEARRGRPYTLVLRARADLLPLAPPSGDFFRQPGEPPLSAPKVLPHSFVLRVSSNGR
jgi:hypothetical protein